MSQIRRDRIAFFPPLGVTALMAGPVQFIAQRLRPVARLSWTRAEGSPRRLPGDIIRSATRQALRIATIDIDRDPWWLYFRRRK